MDLQQQLGEWYPLLSHVFATEWMQKLGRRLGAAENVVPVKEHWFRAFQLCPPSKVKVVICLQDPYINGEADGLAMSSFGKMTPSLEVVFEEINRTHQYKRTQTHLDDWAEQGVLLINAALTTRMGKSRAHQGWGWENFTQEVFLQVLRLPQPIVVMNWGRDAQDVWTTAQNLCKRKGYVTHTRFLVLRTYHPIAQARNPTFKFVGCNHFVQANLFLLKHGVSPIWWCDRKSMGHHSYTELITHLQKQCEDAKIDCPKVVYSYPPVQQYKRHPFDTGLGSQYNETLPF